MGEGKNLVGTFYQPKAVIADVSLLSTLPHKEIISGYAEVIKYAVLGNKAFFEWLKVSQKELLDLNTDLLVEAVATSCKMKAQIVEKDEYENGSRALLNLGHTFGHAIENKMNNNGSKILHGEAVGLGMCLSAQFSNKINLCSADDTNQIIALIEDAGIPSHCSDLKVELKAIEITDILSKDKKRKDDKNTLILLNGIGEAFIKNGVEDNVINDFLISVGFK
jgi:3-dehydroquinate synthase